MKFRRTLASVLAACLLAGSCITPAAVQGLTPPPYGDVNLDFQVDVSDAVLLARYCVMDPDAEIREEGKIWGDVNRDGSLDEKDMTNILLYIAKKIDFLGVPDQPEQQKGQTVNLMADIKPEKVTGKEADDVFTASQMKLAVDLLKGAAADPESDGKDLLVSPLSVSQAIAMVTNGAKGETQEEMEKLLGDTLDIDALNLYYSDYTNNLPSTDDAKLHLANSIWIRDNKSMIQVPQEFLQTTSDYYHADAFTAPFDQTTVNDVNNWVKENTFEMIPQIVDDFDRSTAMVLINALAFDAVWKVPYNEYQISKGVFHAYDGDMNAEMMRSEENGYLHDQDATGFVKDYADENYCFAAILPNEGVTVSDYLGKMTGESLQNLLDTQLPMKVDATIPKFTYDYTLEMSSMLKKLGMRKAFSSNEADLTGLNSLGRSFIDMVLHKTFIQVDEKGTKAGAATMIGVRTTAVEMKMTVTLDRPFIYMILDKRTNLPVFIGYVLHPTEASETK